jgi:hypothetical protein
MYSKNYMKKIGSLALAGVMAFSLAIPAFASDDSGEKKEDESSSSTTETTETTGTNTTTEIETTYQEIPIAVTVPTTGAAQINPYGLPVEVKDGDDVIAEITGQQITTAPLYITNNGNIALSVGATVTAETKGSVNLVTSAIVTSGKSANTGKDIYAYLQMAKVADVKDVVVTDAATDLTTPVATVCADSTAWSSTNNLVLNPDEEVSRAASSLWAYRARRQMMTRPFRLLMARASSPSVWPAAASPRPRTTSGMRKTALPPLSLSPSRPLSPNSFQA